IFNWLYFLSCTKINDTKSSEENFYVRYTTDAWSTSSLALFSFAGTTGTATIPAQDAETEVVYYVFSTTLSNPSVDYDLITLNYDNNSGSNYSYTVKFGTTQTGNWNASNTWKAGSVPANKDVVIGHDITLDISPSVLSLFINSGTTFTASNDSKSNETLIISDGGTLTNNGTFTAGTGKVSFDGAGTVSGTVAFNDVDIAGGVDFGSSSTINGTLTINAGGFVNTNAPTYGTGSTLQYNTVNVFSRNLEWSNSTGAGFPYNVQISNNSSLNLGANSGTDVERLIANDLIIDAGSSLFLDYGEDDMTKSLVVNGDVTVNGTISLSNEIGGDLKLKGNLTFGANSTFNANERAIFFNGETTQTVQATSASTYTIAYIIVGETGGDATTLQLVGGDIIANAPQGGNALTFSNATDKIDLNGNKISIGTADVTSTISGSGSFIGSTTSEIEVLGNGDITLNLDQTTPGTTNAIGTFTVNRPTGVVTIGTAATIPAAGVWTVEPSSKLTVSGTLTNQNTSGGIVLASPTSSGPSGSLILDKTNGFTGSGKITANRYIAAYTTAEDGWHLFASPFDNFDVTGTNLEPSSTLDEEDDLYFWDEAVGDNGTWMNWKASSFNLDAGKGYLISSFASETKSWTGTPYHDDKVFSDLSHTNPHPTENNTWHLLGNPFTSALIWNNSNGWNLLNIGGAAKVMDVTDGSYIDINEGGVIPAFQGFFVSVENSTNSITISRDARSHEATNFYKSAGQYVKLSANDIDKALAQESNLYFSEYGSETFDYRTDSRMLPLYAPGFYSLKDNHKLSTNSLPAINEELVIPFGFETNGSTNFEIELTESTVAYPIFLTDNKTGTIHKLSENPVYSFTASEGDNPNRFLLHFGVVGIGEQEQAPTLQAYLVDNRLYVNNSLEQAQLAVYDLQGRLVAEQSLNSGGLQSLPLDLPAGMYIVRLNNASESRSLKINVQ
ncbi:MAG: T9SS type A sorting domain-containing protein, partial [Bacteroidetes bacterium]|nr:T9SS type A sorting domain-containing protein [Bacteroidota bacterium]